MALDPYRHEHQGIRELSWVEIGHIFLSMAETIARDWRPDIVMGIAKGGVIPAVFLSSAFMVDFYPIKLSSRHNEHIISDMPVWHVWPTGIVKDKKVLLVDDICVAGRTLGMAAEEIALLGAAEIRTASIAAHTDSVRPDYTGIVTDACLVWPWDRDVLLNDGKWAINPEYLEEMKKFNVHRYTNEL